MQQHGHRVARLKFNMYFLYINESNVTPKKIINSSHSQTQKIINMYYFDEDVVQIQGGSKLVLLALRIIRLTRLGHALHGHHAGTGVVCTCT